MNSIIYNYIIQAILGAASGYITNDYAINMLFKEYTPLKMGGIIKKTRNEFIDNLSSLVENDLINKEKINKILTDDEFKSKFEDITEDFFTNYLYEAGGDSIISNIDGIDSSIKLTGEFLDSILNSHMEDITAFIEKNINSDDFLTVNQVEKIGESLADSLLNTINNTDIIDSALNLLYSEKGYTKIKDIINIPEEKIIKITDNALTIFHSIITNDLNKDFDLILNEIIESLIANNKLSIERFYEKTFKDILKINDKFKNDAGSLLVNYVNSDTFQNMICDICKSLFLYLKNIDKTLYDFMDSSFEINLKSYFIYSLPNLTDYLTEWVDFNSKNIDKLIEDSINEVIQESDKMKSILLHAIKNTYLNNLREKYNIVEKIQLFIEKETEPYKLSEKISNEIIGYLRHTSISEIIYSAEKQNTLTPEKLKNYITEYLNDNSNLIVDKLINYILELKIKDSLSNGLISMNIIKNKFIELFRSKILSSAKINSALNNKVNKYMSDLMKKNINDIVPKNIDNVITGYLNKNRFQIQSLIIKNINIQEISIDNKNLSNLISYKIKEKYFAATEEYKNKNLSLALDEINSIENLNKNTSEVLRSFIINNMDYWISGSVKAIVYENLNKLNDDELVNFANDFIGRELQPIMYFGGILGALAGLILALIQNSPPDFGGITLANMATYALVGFITNVIAINMIFKPYKEIKWLSKIPFLRNFALGYIIKNQKIFAKSTSHFVNKTLLSKESINELFGKYESNIKTSFYSNIEKDNFSLFQKILNNNLVNIISNSYKYTVKLIKRNNEKISRFLFNKLEATKVSTFLKTFKIKIISFTKNKILKSDKKLGECINLKFNSNDSLQSQLPVDLVNLSKIHAKKYIENYYDNINHNISLDNIKEKLNIHKEKYINYINTPIGEIFNQQYIDDASSLISKKAAEIILSFDSRQKILVSLENIFLKSIDENKDIGNLFHGKIRGFASKNLPLLFDRILNLIKSIIVENKAIVSLRVQSEIKNNLSLLEKGMYSMFGGGEIVDDIISKIMIVKMPQFIDNKKDELLTVFSGTMSESFYELKIEKLYENINKTQMNEVINNYFSNSSNHDLIEDNINITIDFFKNQIKNISLNSILNILSFENIYALFNDYSNEINDIFSSFSLNMAENKEKIIGKIEIILYDIIDKFIKTASFNNLLHDISMTDIEMIIDNLFKILNEDDFLNKFIEKALNFYIEYTDEIYISEFINKDEFFIASEKFIGRILINDSTEGFIKKLFTSIINKAVNNKLNFIDENTKSYLTDLFIESSMQSIKGNLNSILKSVEFDKIAQEEIETMDARKIHELFNSFCGKYFKKLMLYGLGGFVFGINMYIGLSLTALKIINEKFFKK